MIFPRQHNDTVKARYKQFLQSDFWKKLRNTKICSVRHCQSCGKTKKLQAHHIRYPANWYQTTLEDLRVLCRFCHRLEHNLLTPAELGARAKKRRKARHAADLAERKYRQFCVLNGINESDLSTDKEISCPQYTQSLITRTSGGHEGNHLMEKKHTAAEGMRLITADA